MNRLMIIAMAKRKRGTFGARLRALREDADLTQDQLIDRLATFGVRIGRSYISELERNADKQPTAEVIIGLARALGCSADYLLGLSDVPTWAANDTPTAGISPEADEVARIIDAMQPETRAYVLYMVRAVAAYMAGTTELPGPTQEGRIAPGEAGRWYFSVRRTPEGAD